MDNYKKLVGEKIREFRKGAGFKTQTDLANAMDLDQPRIAKWESGASLPDPKNLKRLCKALGIEPSDLDFKVEDRQEAQHNNSDLIVQIIDQIRSPALKESQLRQLLDLATKFSASSRTSLKTGSR